MGQLEQKFRFGVGKCIALGMHDVRQFQVTPFMEMRVVGLDKLFCLIEIVCFPVADAAHPWSELSGYQSFIYLTHIIFKHNTR